MKRHIFSSSKQTITAAMASVLLATTFMSGTAFADPDNPETDTTETQVITETEVTRETIDNPDDGVIELAPAVESDTTMEDTVDLLEAPVTEDSEDRIIIREKTEVMTETTEIPNDAEQVDAIDAAPAEDETQIVIEQETEISVEPTPEESGEPQLTAAATDTAGYVCHVQPSGDTECICKSDESCAALTNSDECQPHTEWRDSDLGGCTKKAG